MSAVSEAQLAANRANAQLSTGPKTEAGKTKVSLNAVKTGLSGRTVLLPTDDVAAYEAMIARFTERWQPATEEECLLVQSLADIDWRMQRIPVLEYGIYAMGAEQFSEEFAAEPDPHIRGIRIQTKTFFTHHKKLLSLQSQDARLRRQRAAGRRAPAPTAARAPGPGTETPPGAAAGRFPGDTRRTPHAPDSRRRSGTGPCCLLDDARRMHRPLPPG